jgi:hypothetical protein
MCSAFRTRDARLLFFTFLVSIRDTVDRVAQSVYRLTTGWTVRGSSPGGGEIFRTRLDRP